MITGRNSSSLKVRVLALCGGLMLAMVAPLACGPQDTAPPENREQLKQKLAEEDKNVTSGKQADAKSRFGTGRNIKNRVMQNATKDQD